MDNNGKSIYSQDKSSQEDSEGFIMIPSTTALVNPENQSKVIVEAACAEDELSSVPQNITINSNPSSAADNGKVLAVVSKHFGITLGETDYEWVLNLIETKIVETETSFPIRIKRTVLRGRCMKIFCADSQSFEWVKAIINSANGEVTAGSPEEILQLKRYGMWVRESHDTNQTLPLLEKGNPGLDKSKFHIINVVPSEKGKIIIFEVEPEMVEFIESKKGKLWCGVSLVKVWLNTKGRNGRFAKTIQNESSDH